MKPSVLIVDDEYRAFQSLPRLIDSEVFSSLWVSDAQQGLKVLKAQPRQIRIVIIDLKASGMGGGGFLNQTRKIAPHAAVLITGPLGPFLYQGGDFYDFHGVNLKEDINTILSSIARKMGIGHGSGKGANRRIRKENRARFGVIIGRSRGINEIYRLIDSLKTSSATVLIQGESGTGKELVAQTIHQTSSRKKHPFVVINCGAIPANLMESELFGHERGAFTTAVNRRKGKFEMAHTGTLFLDEIGELEKGLQVKLLRVLQEREFQRVGGNKTYQTDVRIVAATSRDLKKAMQAGHFRDDLFYRLNVVPVHIPPLRERTEDILLLIAHFFKKMNKEMGCKVPLPTEEAMEALRAYPYPGNVRELINMVERMLVTCSHGTITRQDLPREVLDETSSSAVPEQLLKALPEGGTRLKDVEKELILKTLQKASGNKMAAARMLGITRRLLYLRLSQYGLSSSHGVSQQVSPGNRSVTAGDKCHSVCMPITAID